MARSVTRIGDECTGHGCFPPRVNDQGSSDVFINGIGAHRQGDHWVTHCCDDSCHDSTSVSGSSTVYVNGIPAVRVGDLIGCGSAAAQGSSNVFFG
jgi:uncharacterized Zn-binding protein involved in type VI secretion